jgi:hypothetical protein
MTKGRSSSSKRTQKVCTRFRWFLTYLIDDERVFLIDESLQFGFGDSSSDALFNWSDLSGDEGDSWEFISSRVGTTIKKWLIAGCS